MSETAVQAPVTSEPAASEAWVDAKRIREHTGRQIRIVYRWVEEGCPHRKIPRGKGQLIQFQISAVEAWLKAQGLDAVKRAPGHTVADAVAARATRDMFDTMKATDPPKQAAEWGSDATPPEKFVSSGDPIEDLTRQIADVQANRPHLTDPAALQRWTTSVSKLSQELRLLRNHRFEEDRRAAKYIERDRAIEIFRSMGEQLANVLDTVAASWPIRMWQAFSAQPGATTDQDAFVRIGQLAAAAECDQHRSRILAEVAALIAALDPAGNGDLGPTGRGIFEASAPWEAA